MGFEGSPSEINLRPGQHAYKTRSTWWYLMDERKSVEGTNAARDKPMVSDSNTQLAHATWQDGDDVLLSHRSCTSLGASSPRKVDGTREKDLWYVPAGFSQGPVCKSRPGPYTRLGQSGCWAPQADRWDERCVEPCRESGQSEAP